MSIWKHCHRCDGASYINCMFLWCLNLTNHKGTRWRIQLHLIYIFILQPQEFYVQCVFKCLCSIKVHVYCMALCVRHRDSINITLPSVKAVQMLSQKKRISAKLREEGDMMRGWGESQSVPKTKSINLRTTDSVRAADWGGGENRETAKLWWDQAWFIHVRDEELKNGKMYKEEEWVR